MFADPLPAAGTGLSLGECIRLGAAGVLCPVGIGGKIVLMLDPGHLSEEGDTATAKRSIPGSGDSGVRLDTTLSEI